MSKADLHVHSCFSSRPSEWFLQRLGTKESYTDPETIYREARKRGMDFVTITDHNEIAGSILLKEKYPEHVFTGVEVTTYFPEDGCKIHLLVYDLTEAHHAEINNARTDIYQLRSYIKEQNLAHSVAHATFSINKKLTISHIERLFLLFDNFEGINGSISRLGNRILVDALSELSPEIIDDLYCKYRINPYSDTPWIKGLTGGSDDHSGLFIARTYTSNKGATPETFIERIKNKDAIPGGRHNDYQGLAFAIYKVAYDFSKSKSATFFPSLFNSVNDLIFEQKSLGLKDRLLLKRMKFSKDAKENGFKRILVDLIGILQQKRDIPIETKLGMVYEKISDIADHFFKRLISELEIDLRHADIIGLAQRISGSFPAVFLFIPFLTTINILNESRITLNDLADTYGISKQTKKRRVLCFTDMIKGIDGFTPLPLLNKLGLTDHEQSGFFLVTCLGDEPAQKIFRVKTLNLPSIYTYRPAFLNSCPVNVPSTLRSLKMIYEAAPDEIHLLTPGPVGILGLLSARLLHVPCNTTYHIDFAHQVKQIVGDASICRVVECFTRWFYSLTDTVYVQTEHDIDDLELRGYKREKMARLAREDFTGMPTFQEIA
ncbi:MAG: hypothetical protein JXD19_06645 [Deltaproteobacteria bacterium]|nr:hypothetical protein [Deltaproteobacteria bacterium]